MSTDNHPQQNSLNSSSTEETYKPAKYTVVTTTLRTSYATTTVSPLDKKVMVRNSVRRGITVPYNVQKETARRENLIANRVPVPSNPTTNE